MHQPTFSSTQLCGTRDFEDKLVSEENVDSAQDLGSQHARRLAVISTCVGCRADHTASGIEPPRRRCQTNSSLCLYSSEQMLSARFAVAPSRILSSAPASSDLGAPLYAR